MAHDSASASDRMLQILRESRLLLAVTLHRPEDWQGLGKLLAETPMIAVEVMLRSPYAWEGIRQLRRNWPKLVLGVGTVLTPADLLQAQAAGANFAVSPGTRQELLDLARDLDFPYLPGAMHASDLMLIAASGWRAVKFFPAAALGPAYLQALAAPFPDLRFCATGGLEVGNYRQFLALSQVAGLSGSWPLPADLSQAEARQLALPLLHNLAEELRLALANENPLFVPGASLP